ncbi:MAG: S9 family peptidase [Anaerolineales bacterium]
MSENKRTAPYGSWASPISAQDVAQAGMSARGSLSCLRISNGRPYWLHLRADLGGRYELLTIHGGGEPIDLLPNEYNARTLVHEYGGGDFAVQDGIVYFTNYDDQRLYRLEPGGEPQPITPEPPSPLAVRYADPAVHPTGDWLVAVMEDHRGSGEAANSLVALPTDGQQAPMVIASGHDFYSNPRFNREGDRLCWLTWDHPNMPWDGSELWLAAVEDGNRLGQPLHIAGSDAISLFQPEWGPDGNLYYVSDRSGWWNLYRWDGEAEQALAPMEAEFGAPAWSFALSRYAFLSKGRIACIYTQDGLDHLALLDIENGQLSDLDVPFTAFRPSQLRSDGENTLWFIASSPTRTQALYSMSVDDGTTLTRLHQPVRAGIGPEYIAAPEVLDYPTANGKTAHAIYYPPVNADYRAPTDTLPPLMVVTHGGPTSAAVVQLNLGVQFWTSRGFAVADVNYGGSTGYGRDYRERLNGNWGVVDVQDGLNVARHLAEQGRVDPNRLVIRGGSAGGYTTLAALTFHDTFTAGASYYGVADLESLAIDDHKFESRYLLGLVGPYPQAKSIYDARSPILHTDQLSCPLILLQGAEDKVVPPEQSRIMAAALEEKGIPYAYLEFEGEQHGFRRAQTVIRSLLAEWYFYSRVFGFELQEEVEPIEIHHLTEGSSEA